MSDLQALALVKSIRFAAVVIGVSLILLGVMVWQPWGDDEPQKATVKGAATPRSGNGVIIGDAVDVDCVRLGENLTCNWPKTR